jgi:hypothetical protein
MIAFVGWGGLRGVLVVVVGVAALALPAAAAAEDPPFVDWNSPIPGMTGTYHASKDADCVDGNPACVEQTLTEMYRRFDDQYATCDHNAAFGITYIRVTEAIRKAITDGVYEDRVYLAHQDRLFARMYFSSYDAWKRGDRAHVPVAWQMAWDAGRDRSVTGLGNLLLSMNAHINRDMPYMLESIGLNKPDGSTRKPDHDRGNAVLNMLYDDVLKELAARFDPTVDDVDIPGFMGDDTAVFQTLQGWREGVWRNAEMLARATDAGQRQAASDYIENYAVSQARLIKQFTTVPSSLSRDAWCAAYRRTHRETGGQSVPAAARHGQRLARTRRVRVRVACPERIRWCAGTVRLMRAKRKLASARLPVIAPGSSKVVRLRVTRRTARVIAHRHRLGVREVVDSPSPWRSTRTSQRRLTLKRPRS